MYAKENECSAIYWQNINTSAEIKQYTDTNTGSSFNLSDSAAIINETGLDEIWTQGTSTQSGRVGQKIRLLSIEVSCYVEILSYDILTPNYKHAKSACRYTFAIVLDKQPNGTEPAVNDIFVTANDFIQNKTNEDRFKILHLHSGPMSIERFENAEASTRSSGYFRVMLPCDINVCYNTGATGRVFSNDIWFVLGCNGNQTTADATSFYKCRADYRYIDN